jgi:hypothetical protein
VSNDERGDGEGEGEGEKRAVAVSVVRERERRGELRQRRLGCSREGEERGGAASGVFARGREERCLREGEGRCRRRLFARGREEGSCGIGGFRERERR